MGTEEHFLCEKVIYNPFPLFKEYFTDDICINPALVVKTINILVTKQYEK